MSSTVLNILLIALLAAVVFVLLRGLLNMARGGSPEKSNVLMRYRVLFQAIAIAVAVALLWLNSQGNG
ncbi:hypothetical protein GCM10011385_15220 [Nitratireductor aestuarii]|uniref:HIG1 domain-containing protein n=1 Tax=Nitratireductor aestuarii TaxID=1735103 RepID=A0A916W301_9HYPH|nr:twin transmembrane helix small protein [Nitratireductor aestuarii]GGA62428.1 hypothetical protein GCM10011385_15220 [Nitratireductor aestuarii]